MEHNDKHQLAFLLSTLFQCYYTYITLSVLPSDHPCNRTRYRKIFPKNESTISFPLDHTTTHNTHKPTGVAVLERARIAHRLQEHLGMRYPFPHLGQFQIAQVHLLGDGLQDLPPMNRWRHHTASYAMIVRQRNRRGRLVDGPGATLVAASAQIATLLQRRRVATHAMQIHVTATGTATAGAVVLRTGYSKCRLERRLCREIVRFR